jgi:hypothetical protein
MPLDDIPHRASQEVSDQVTSQEVSDQVAFLKEYMDGLGGMLEKHSHCMALSSVEGGSEEETLASNIEIISNCKSVLLGVLETVDSAFPRFAAHMDAQCASLTSRMHAIQQAKAEQDLQSATRDKAISDCKDGIATLQASVDKLRADNNQFLATVLSTTEKNLSDLQAMLVQLQDNGASLPLVPAPVTATSKATKKSNAAIKPKDPNAPKAARKPKDPNSTPKKRASETQEGGGASVCKKPRKKPYVPRLQEWGSTMDFLHLSLGDTDDKNSFAEWAFEHYGSVTDFLVYAFPKKKQTTLIRYADVLCQIDTVLQGIGSKKPNTDKARSGFMSFMDQARKAISHNNAVGKDGGENDDNAD